MVEKNLFHLSESHTFVFECQFLIFAAGQDCLDRFQMYTLVLSSAKYATDVVGMSSKID